MFSNTNKKMKQILMNMDPAALEKGLKAASEMMNTPEGKKLVEQLKNTDKQKLMEQFNSIDEQDLIKKIDNLDVNELNQKVNSIDKETLLHEMSNNPELMKKINDLLNK
ncbi:MAG: DUF3523 domain-containing protein [Clostridia bacterium]